MANSKPFLTPLGLIGSFIGLIETGIITAVIKTTGTVQSSLTYFLIFFTISIGIAFFYTLLRHPAKLYPPSEYESSAEFLNAVNTVKVKADEVEKIAKRVEELKADLENKITYSSNYAIEIALALRKWDFSPSIRRG